jgi:uncharacterized protein YkwD
VHARFDNASERISNPLLQITPLDTGDRMPHVPRHLFAVALSLVLSGTAVVPALSQMIEEEDVESLETTDAPTRGGEVDAKQAAQQIIEQTNTFRESENVQTVHTDSHLMEAAQYFADYMARTDRYGHGADGNRPSQRAKNHGYEYCVIAENIAYRYNSAGYQTDVLANKFVEGWKNSPEHRENMLNQNVVDTGVAVSQSESTGHWYGVQMFGRSKSAAIEFQIRNESDADVDYSIGKKTYQLPAHYARTHMSCRVSAVQFDFPNTDGSSDSQIQPENGDRFAVARVDGQLQVQQEKSGESPQR